MLITFYRYLYMVSASSLRTVSCTFRTSTFTVLVPNRISRVSPAFTARDARAGFPFTSNPSRVAGLVRHAAPLDEP